MNSPVEEIKARLDIAEFIQSYVRLEKAGMNLKAPCPFHAEKTPSFFVSPSRQIWHCFGGCGEGGDIFKFAMKIEGLEFPEALRLLAQRAGVVLHREDPRLRSERNRLYEICEEAACIFERSLSLTAEPRVYLRERGVNEDTIRAFRIGWAPASWDFLLKALGQKGFAVQDIEKAGLAIRRGQTRTEINADRRRDSPRESALGWYDRFRSRIMFPIGDANGRVIGFGGRVFESGIRNQESGRTEAKYINTSQTLIYDKSRALYGLDKAKQEIRASNQAVAVEGYMDCVMSHQAGVKNTIAVSGTALTPQQLKVLRRLCDTMVSSFDADAAGESATKRSLSLAAQFEFNRRIAAIPSGKDPADTVKEDPEAWLRAVAEAKPVVQFYFEKTMQSENRETPDGKKKISQILLPLIAELPDEIEKAHWVLELARGLLVAEEAVWKELSRKGTGAAPQTLHTEEEQTALPSRRALLEDRFLALLANSPDVAGRQALGMHHIVFGSDLNRRLFEALSGGADRVPPEAVAHLENLRFKGEVLRDLVSDPESELVLCHRELEKICIKERLMGLGQEIQRIEREAGGQAAVLTLLENFRALSERLKVIA